MFRNHPERKKKKGVLKEEKEERNKVKSATGASSHPLNTIREVHIQKSATSQRRGPRAPVEDTSRRKRRRYDEEEVEEEEVVGRGGGGEGEEEPVSVGEGAHALVNEGSARARSRMRTRSSGPRAGRNTNGAPCDCAPPRAPAAPSRDSRADDFLACHGDDASDHLRSYDLPPCRDPVYSRFYLASKNVCSNGPATPRPRERALARVSGDPRPPAHPTLSFHLSASSTFFTVVRPASNSTNRAPRGIIYDS